MQPPGAKTNKILSGGSISGPNHELIIYPKLALCKMQIIMIPGLEAGRVIRNHFVIGTVVDRNVSDAFIQLRIEDETKASATVYIRSIPTRLADLHAAFLLKSRIAIKNPYLHDGSTGIVVEDHQDVVPLWDYSAAQLLGRPVQFSSAQLKEMGNKFYQQKNYFLSYECYTLSISQPANEDLREICFNNRALVLHQLGYFKQAVTDLESVLKINPNNQKGLFRMATALMKLNRLSEARLFFYRIQGYDKDQEIALKLVELEQRQRFMEGKFDVYEIFKRYSLERTTKGVYAFNGPYERKQSTLAGHGLFATRSIRRGEVLLLELPLHSVVLKNTGAQGQEEMQQQFVTELKWLCASNLSLAEEVFKLYDGTSHYGVEMLTRDFEYALERPSVSFKRVDKIITLNAHVFKGFNLGENQEEGLWQQLAFINHRCFPNCLYYYCNDLLILVSMKAIEAGEELLVSYKPATSFEDYESIMQAHEIPIEPEVKRERQNWPKDKRFEMLNMKEKISPPQWAKVCGELKMLLKKEYPLRYIQILSELSMDSFRAFNIEQFFQNYKENLKFIFYDLPQSDLFYSLILVSSVKNQFPIQDKELDRLIAEIGTTIFGASFSKDPENWKVLLRYAEKDAEIDIGELS